MRRAGSSGRAFRFAFFGFFFALSVLIVWVSSIERLEKENKERQNNLQSLTVEELIDRLQEVSKPGIGYHPTAFTGDFIATVSDIEFHGGIIGSERPEVPAALRELVRRGTHSLPGLLAHLEDPRPTHCGTGSALHLDHTISRIYDPRYKDPAHQPGLLPTIWEASDPYKDEFLTEESDGRLQYRVKVGDLCFVAIGQIVNRRLAAIDYEPSAIVLINSPVLYPKMAKACRQDWSNLTPEAHERSLMRDCLAFDFTISGAMERLRFYYPETWEEIYLKLLKRNLYDSDFITNFISENLIKPNIITINTVNARINNFRDTFDFICSSLLSYRNLCYLLPDLEYKFLVFCSRVDVYSFNVILNKSIEEAGINGVDSLLNDFKVKYGVTAYQAIPIELQRGFTDQASSPIEESLIQRKTQKILRTFFPEHVGDEPLFCESASPGHLRSLIESAGIFSTARIDRALYALFQKIAVFQPESYDSRKLVLLCIDRLVGKGHDREFRSYLEKQIQRKKADWKTEREERELQIEELEIRLKQLVN